MNIKELDTFGKRMRFIMDTKDIKNVDLAAELNLAPNTISSYLNDKRSPDLVTLTKIADFLNVNVDFLLRRTDDYATYIHKEINGKDIEVEFDDEKMHLTAEEINKVFKNLELVGFDIKKLL